MKKIKAFLLIISIVLGFNFIATPMLVGAVDVNIYNACKEGDKSEVCTHKDDNIKTYLKSGINLLLYVIAAVAVVMIILSGIYYTISGGNSGTVTKAKDTLLYSVVGLVVAILAYAIVNFVLLNIK